MKGSSWWAVVAVGGLAGLDLLGAMLAKQYAIRPRWLLLTAGMLTFAALFVLYAKSLAVGELWVVTFGWVILLEVGVLALDRVRFGTAIGPYRLTLAVLLVVGQLALVVSEPRAATTVVVPTVARTR
jgi:hypothetical protein